MTIYHLPNDTDRIPAAKRTVALGLFDGMHIGHRAVVAEAVRAGRGHCAVYTFSSSTLYTKGDLRRVATDAQQAVILERMGVTELFEADFTAVCDLSPEQFVEAILQNTLHATAVTCGFNYRFGKGGVGDAALLERLCAVRGIAVKVVAAVKNDGQTVSSTAIRSALAEGDMASVTRMMNRAYCFDLPVEQGQHLGRRLGMPTVNQVLPADLALPRFGVYASCVEIGGQVHYGVTNVGVRPTVGADAPLAETWIDGFDGDLYGQSIRVYPVKFLRDERAFDTLEELKAQIEQDAADARDVFHSDGDTPIKAVLFDYDDTLHLRDYAFRIACHLFLYKHYPTISEEEHAARWKTMVQFDDYGYRRPLSYPDFIKKYLREWEPTCADPAEALREFFLDFADNCVLLDDAVDTLCELRHRGYRIGVITNGGSFTQDHKLGLSGLRPYVDITLVSEAEGFDKPHTEIFRRAAARLGVPCAACLFVGDHPINDICGARAAGMAAVRIDYGFAQDHPIYERPIPPGVPEIHRLSELLELPSLGV